MLLLCSGDVELNPGSKNSKKCPYCLDETVPIKLKICTFGYVFHKKTHRQPPKCCLTPLTTVTNKTVIDDGDVPIVQSQPEFMSPDVVVKSDMVVDTNIVNDNEPPIVKSKSVIKK